MKILFFGDIFGRSGRDALIKEIPYFKKKYNPDFILVNGDPVADIKVLQDQSAITNVIKDGKFYTGLSDHNPYLSAEESEKNRKIKEEQLGKIEKEKIESAG